MWPCRIASARGAVWTGRTPNGARHSVVMTIDDAAIERLVTEAQQGDAWAFGMIFDHYHESIYRFIASRVHRPSDAEDLTQHVFVKALEALPRYESRGIPFGGWLFRLARNAVIDHVRTRHDHAELDSIIEWTHGDAGPDEIAVVRQELDAVGVALAGLTDDQREAIALRFFAGLSARETAEAMGKQEGTVRGLQFRAIAALRRQLGIDLDGDVVELRVPRRANATTDG
jgi:RNA polymerase sigma-70 factor (ECF subfamily)